MHIIWYKHFGIMAAHRYAGCAVRHARMKSVTMSSACGASEKHNAMRLLRCAVSMQHFPLKVRSFLQRCR